MVAIARSPDHARSPDFLCRVVESACVYWRKLMGMRKLSFLVSSLILLAGICGNATERQNNADYRARRVALAKQMEGGTLVLFAPTEAEGQNDLYGFRQDDNFYYLTGWAEPGAALL